MSAENGTRIADGMTGATVIELIGDNNGLRCELELAIQERDALQRQVDAENSRFRAALEQIAKGNNAIGFYDNYDMQAIARAALQGESE